MKMIKVRFNLGRGENYMKWKIIQSDGKIEYYAPDDVQLVMQNCILKNNKKLAQRIFEGENKDVCAWIRCESITINHSSKDDYYVPNLQVEKLMYNPKIAPFWRFESANYPFDNCEFSEIFTDHKNLYVEIK